jgi:hypothetical protein
VSARRVILGAQAVVLLSAGAAALGAAWVAPDLSDISLRRSRDAISSLRTAIAEHRFTVVTFFSSTCPCFAVHRARLAALARETEARGVRFIIVDSERRASGQAAAAPAFVPDTALPLFRDEEARLARRLGARFATETFVFDVAGTLRYQGGIDDDRTVLSRAPRARLREELVALLDGAAPAFVSTKSLGCVLRLR